MGAPSTVRHAMDGTVRPPPTPQAALLLRQLAQLLEYDDVDTIANVNDYVAFRLECLAARDAVPH